MLSALATLFLASCSKDNDNAPEEIVYTVSFDANNGSGTVPAMQKTVNGTSVVLPDGKGLTPPSGSNKFFTGWNTSPDNSGVFFKAGDTFIPQGNTILYAVWKENSKLTIARFKSYFYKEDGQVRANKLPSFSEKEWAVAAEDSNRPCEVFSDITGMEAPSDGKYDFTYRTEDGKCILRLVGTDQPKEDAAYAVLYVEIDECPEIGKIHIYTTEYFKDNNTNMSGVPVIL